MTNGIGIVGSAQGATAPAGAVVSANLAAIDNKPLAASASPGISPRIVVDPLAGPITQFLNSTGQVQSQIPSSAVVAYLRAGLTSQGLSKPNETPHAAHHASTTA